MHEKQEENYTEYSKTKFPLNISNISDKIQFTENESQIAISLNVHITYKYNKSITSTQHPSIKI